MGRVIMNGPPDCGAGEWCPYCLMEAKEKQWQTSQDDIDAGFQASGEKLTVIPWPDGLTKELKPGRFRAVSGSAPHLGMCDGLCWDHVAGIAPMHAPPLVDGQGRPAGLIKGRR
jgi:hypothetical protein